MSPTVPTETSPVLSHDATKQVLSTILAVEKVAPELPGQTKAQIVLNAISAGVEVAPAILSLITAFVGILNGLGIFKKKAKVA